MNLVQMMLRQKRFDARWRATRKVLVRDGKGEIYKMPGNALELWRPIPALYQGGPPIAYWRCSYYRRSRRVGP